MSVYLEFCIAVRTLCRLHALSVTSWFRSVKRNDAVGGVGNSRHLEGLGCDLVPDPGANRQAIISTARLLGLQVVDEKDHIHVELDP